MGKGKRTAIRHSRKSLSIPAKHQQRLSRDRHGDTAESKKSRRKGSSTPHDSCHPRSSSPSFSCFIHTKVLGRIKIFEMRRRKKSSSGSECRSGTAYLQQRKRLQHGLG